MCLLAVECLFVSPQGLVARKALPAARACIGWRFAWGLSLCVAVQLGFSPELALACPTGMLHGGCCLGVPGIAIVYIGLQLPISGCTCVPGLHLSMVVLCLWWCICLWWHHICVAETAVAPAKMRYSICRPGVFLHMDNRNRNRNRTAFLHMGNWGSRVCRPGVFSVQAAPVVEDWGPSVCRPGVFCVQGGPEPRAYGGRLGSECM